MTLQPLGTFIGTGDTLARMVAKGRCSIDDLDHEPPGTCTGYKPKNMLRDWIIVNAAKWQQIQDEFNYVQTKRENDSEFTYQVSGYCKGYSYAAKKPYGVKIEKIYI